MLKVILLASIGVSFLCVKASAQKINTDSLKLITKISDDQLKLGKLQNTVDQKTRDKGDDAIAAQKSADKNATAANKLSNDPENKKDARQANSSAANAKSNARKARQAANRLDKTNKDIADLESKIAKEQAELNKYLKLTNNMSVVPTPVQQDSTQH
jgi:hypothetical protein